jgi:hypothetical protein
MIIHQCVLYQETIMTIPVRVAQEALASVLKDFIVQQEIVLARQLDRIRRYLV